MCARQKGLKTAWLRLCGGLGHAGPLECLPRSCVAALQRRRGNRVISKPEMLTRAGKQTQARYPSERLRLPVKRPISAAQAAAWSLALPRLLLWLPLLPALAAMQAAAPQPSPTLKWFSSMVE